MTNKTKKKNTVKKEPKKVVKKESVKQEEKVEVERVKTEEVKTETKKKSGRILSYRVTALLYLVCAICWFISGALSYVAEESFAFDIVIGTAFLAIGIIYACNIKKDRQ